MIRTRPLSVAVLAAMLVVPFAISACAMPRDPAGTEDRVARTGVLRLGIVKGAVLDEPGREALTKILRKTGSVLEVTEADSESLLTKIKQGEIDLAYGKFAMSSPWSKEVAFSAAPGLLGKPAKGVAMQRFVMMKGENGWIMLVGKAAR